MALSSPRWLLALLVGGCGSTPLPEEHLYVLPAPAPAGAGPGPAFVVGRFRGEGLARGATLWARVSEIEVEAWRRHRFALPIPDLVADAVAAWARGTGRYAEVSRGETAPGGAALALEGAVLAFEELEGEAGWEAVVRLELTLSRLENGRSAPLWGRSLEERVPAPARHPAAVVRALGEALTRLLDRAAASWPTF